MMAIMAQSQSCRRQRLFPRRRADHPKVNGVADIIDSQQQGDDPGDDPFGPRPARFARKGRQNKGQRDGQENDNQMRQTEGLKSTLDIHRRDKINGDLDRQALSNHPEIARNDIGHP